MIKKVKYITLLLFKEMVRNRIFILFTITAVFLVFVSLILDKVVVGQQIKATKDLGLSILNVFSLFVLVFLGVPLISKHLNHQRSYFLFSKPVKRLEFLLGSSLSVLLVIIYMIVIICLTIMAVSFIQNEAWISGVIFAGFLTLLEMIMILSIAILLSIMLSPKLVIFLTLLIYIIGHSIEKVVMFFDKITSVGVKYILITIYALFPDFEFFNRKTEIVYGMNLPFSYFFYVSLYSITFTILIFMISVYIFNRKRI